MYEEMSVEERISYDKAMDKIYAELYEMEMEKNKLLEKIKS